MGTVAMSLPSPLRRSSSDLASLDAAIALDVDLDGLDSQTAQAIPRTHLPASNKHIPVCPPGPPVASTTPSPSPPPSEPEHAQQSLLYPPDEYPCIEMGEQHFYAIEPASVAAAIDYISRQPLPDPSLVFPWLHGIHRTNLMQQSFFSQRRRAVGSVPSCLRGLTIVKANGDLERERIKGAVHPDEILNRGAVPEFIDADPKEGFSVRNFQIQTAKTATVSDIIVYGQDYSLVMSMAHDIAAAQEQWRKKIGMSSSEPPMYNTFACVADFAAFDMGHSGVVAIDSLGNATGNVINFSLQERHEMYAMATASEVSHNVWLGPTPDADSGDGDGFDVLIECSDMGHLNPGLLRSVAEDPECRKIALDFPASGTVLPPTWSRDEADAILETCKWIYYIAHGIRPPPDATEGEGEDETSDSSATDEAHGQPQRKVLIHCADGYTESTMLGLAYYSYSTGTAVPDAWLSLHTEKMRNFFAYQTDVALLSALAPRLLSESPVNANKSTEALEAIIQSPPRWFCLLDGSLPSRVMDYMYLGNLNHANNPELLKAMGITQILSVGEVATWREQTLEEWGEDNFCIVHGVQDNGIDPLSSEFERCLEFIERGRKKGTATLVHCRVGVSRSATICIAEVMRSLKMSLPQAYCFVRARRLNVIIQPHLRFAYELLKWEEHITQAESGEIKRELEWSEVTREVALMNQPYVR